MTSDITNDTKNHVEHLNKNKKSWHISERDHYINYCHLQRLTAKQAKTALQSFGYTITDDIYYNVKKKMDKQSYKKLEYLTKDGFVIQHIERIASLELVQTELWKQYNMTPKDKTMDKVTILEKIAALQQYISSYYDASKYFKDLIPLNKKSNLKIIGNDNKTGIANIRNTELDEQERYKKAEEYYQRQKEMAIF